jgi:tyrosyl-tRNA synthetase
MKLVEDLKWRGLVHQCTDIDGLEKLLDSESVTLYCGFDPTADSLHVGHLIPMISLMRFKQHGHNPLALIGGATGFIGDPSGKSQERVALMEEVVLHNSEAIGKQLASITKVKTVNNLDWTKNMSVIDFMRNIGKNFSIGAMLARDSVSSRLNGDGLSFTEFSYMLFQGNDFLHLAKEHNCQLQIGGSDQFGNMCSGLDLLRRNQKEGFALTFPLLTKSDGTKFGKSEKGSVWLDAEKTSPWDFFQFWLNTADADVVKLLKLYTFLSHEKILELEDSTVNRPELRAAQKALAVEMTTLIHGADICQSIQEVAELLFSGKKFELSNTGINILKSIIPVVVALRNVLTLQEFKQALVQTELLASMTKATQAIKDNSISILEVGKEAKKITEDMKEIEISKPTLIKKGKKHFALIV